MSQTNDDLTKGDTSASIWRARVHLAAANRLAVYDDLEEGIDNHFTMRANVILHTHQTWALALNMLQDNRLLPGSQTAAFLTRNIAYDDGYTGLADSLSEGERLARALGDKHIMFLKNHGVIAVGDNVAAAMMRVLDREMPGYAD